MQEQMTNPSTTAVASRSQRADATADDALSICAISIVAGLLTNILHEGMGHGLVALLTGAQSGVLTTVAWSSAFDPRLVEAGGTLANLAAALVFWFALRSVKTASMPRRYFLLITGAFNLFTGTGYFFFRRNKFRRLGGCDFSALSALALAGIASDRGSVFILRLRAACRDWTGALRRSSARPAEAIAKVDHGAVFLSHSACERGGSAESTRNTTAVAIRAARHHWRSERAAMVAILHTARNGAEASTGTGRSQLRADRCGGCFGAPVCCRSRARNNTASLNAPSGRGNRIGTGSRDCC